jgi:beta-lactamase superfamily II metal-dependent hydrolase
MPPIVEIYSVKEYVDRLDEISTGKILFDNQTGLRRVAFSRAVEDELERRYLLKQAELQRQLDAIIKAQALTATVKTGDKPFIITFIQMGQGDCCVVKTPGGKIMLIDCGTTSANESAVTDITKVTIDADWSDKNGIDKAEPATLNVPEPAALVKRVQTILAQDLLLGTRKKIDYLILTHSDKDHYNKLQAVLGDTMQFGEVYHSNNLSEYSTASIATFIGTNALDANKIYRVAHNDPKSKKVELTTPSDVVLVVNQDVNGGYRILNEDNCKIWLMASDVTDSCVTNPPDDGGATDANKRSIVTLIEVFGKKILICGDATRVTEKYLLDTSAETCKDVDILQAPHHGSDTTSSSGNFVAKTNPRNVVVSASRKDNQHSLPQQNTLRAYFRKMKASGHAELGSDHMIFYWARSGSNIHVFSLVKRPIYTTGSQNSFGWTILKKKDKVEMTYVDI